MTRTISGLSRCKTLPLHKKFCAQTGFLSLIETNCSYVVLSKFEQQSSTSFAYYYFLLHISCSCISFAADFNSLDTLRHR